MGTVVPDLSVHDGLIIRLKLYFGYLLWMEKKKGKEAKGRGMTQSTYSLL